MFQSHEVNFSLIMFSATISLLVLVALVFIFLRKYQQKQYESLREKAIMQANFQQELLQSQIEIQEQTFNHISQELHDNVGQLLTSARIQLSLMELEAKSDIEMVRTVKSNIGSAIADLRDIATSLSGVNLQDSSLLTKITEEAARLQRSKLVNINIRVSGSEREMNSQNQLIIYRIIQESLQNILKHANTKNGSIHLNYTIDHLQVYIQDEGQGFDLKKSGTGMGLLNMQKRSEAIRGKLVITTGVGQGTTITLTVPYE